MVYLVNKREWEGSSAKYREATIERRPSTELSQQLWYSFLPFFRTHGAKRSVCLAEPSMPSAPLGGRLREADTRPCLVVSPVFVAWSSKSCRVLAILVRRRGRHPYGPRPAASGQAGLGRAANYCRVIAPDRGQFRPRSAPNNRQCASATLCHFDTAIAADSILGVRITSTYGQ